MTGRGQPQMLIRTKLRRPRVPEGLLQRERLLDRLNTGLARPLTLVAAPAGSGKTTLLSSWLDRCPWPSAWLALDESDSDLLTFLAYFLAAIETMFPDALDATRAQLDALSLPTVPDIAARLGADLEGVGQPFVLVLDDYHLIHHPAVHALLAALLRHPPPTLHLVLSARHDPPLPLAQLRSQQHLAELRSHDLRLTPEEIAAFCQLTLGRRPDDPSLARLAEKTEGWVAALALAARTLTAAPGLDARLAELSADNRYVMDYLLAEVLLRQPPALQTFLLQTAILERLSGPLCDAVAPPPAAGPDGQTCLERLAESNLFTEALDEQRQWYRYHPLFRQLLGAELPRRYPPAEIAAGHARASAWYAAQGLIEPALRHALAAADPAAAAALLAQQRQTLLNQEQWPRLERWLRLLPAALIDQQPELLLAEAWLAYHRAQPAELQTRLAQAARLAPPPHPLTGELAALRSHLAYQAGDGPAALGHARQALASTPPTQTAVRHFARRHLAAALQLTGHLQTAYATVYEGLMEDQLEDTSFLRAVGLFGFVEWIAGDLPDLSRTVSRVLQTLRDADLPETAGWAHYWFASVHYQRNNLAEAEAHFNAVLALRHSVHAECFLYSVFGLALTYQAQHRPDTARQVVESAAPDLMAMHSTVLTRLATAFQAELALLQGDVAAAGRWAAGVGAGVPPNAREQLYPPQLTLAKVLLAENTPAGRSQAAQVLEELYDFLSTIHNQRFLIETLALQGLLHDQVGDERAALAAVQRAIDLAQPGGFIRLFVDLGPGMAGLLVRLSGLGRPDLASNYVGQILQAFVDARAPAPSALRAGLTAPLTHRELEILALLAQRRSNKEIAQELVISPQTVKRHTLNIYQKLQVNGRRPAVHKAASMGLLA